MGHQYKVKDKTVQVRPGTLNASLAWSYGYEYAVDDGTRYRYECCCGHRGRWFADPHRAKEAGENHLIRVYGD